jgi:hypothetical protein
MSELEFQSGWEKIDPNGRWKRLTSRGLFEIDDVGDHRIPQYALYVALSGQELISHPDDPAPFPTLQAAQARAWYHYQRI